MPKARIRMPKELEGLLASDWKHVLEEATLGAEDAEIARLYIIERMPQVDVAAEMSLDRSTVSRRVEGILDKARRVAVKLEL